MSPPNAFPLLRAVSLARQRGNGSTARQQQEIVMRGFLGHESPVANHHDWITPKPIIDALGIFDLDPCQSHNQPWACASRGYTADDDGLTKPWSGCVWLNPPYGRDIERWIARLAEHGNGVALMFARTDTKWFHSFCSQSHGMLFLAGRVRFFDGQGHPWMFRDEHGAARKPQPGGAAATSPSVLVAFGEGAWRRVWRSSLIGMRMVSHA